MSSEFLLALMAFMSDAKASSEAFGEASLPSAFKLACDLFPFCMPVSDIIIWVALLMA